MAVTENGIEAESEDTGGSKQAEATAQASDVQASAEPVDEAPANTVDSPTPRTAAPNETMAVASGNLELLSGVELPVTLCFGRRRMRLREVLDLNAGSVVELDRLVEEPVELLLHGRVIARGDVVVVDGNYGLRVLEVVRASGGVNA